MGRTSLLGGSYEVQIVWRFLIDEKEETPLGFGLHQLSDRLKLISMVLFWVERVDKVLGVSQGS